MKALLPLGAAILLGACQMSGKRFTKSTTLFVGFMKELELLIPY